MDYVGILGLGLIFSVFVLGMIISFRFLGFADLTIEGSFTLGGIIFASCLNSGLNPILCVIFVIVGGGLAGLFTAMLHCYVGINKLLAGITTLTMLYTVNLRILGKSNMFLDNVHFFNQIDNEFVELFIIIGFALSVFVLLRLFLSTNFGLYLRATGENDVFVKNLKTNPKLFIIIGLTVANAFIAFSGCLFCQYVGYSDIGSGQGMLVSMLAAMIIGENIVRPTTVTRQLLAAFGGAIVFQFLYSLALQLGVNPIDLKILIGFLLIVFFVITKYSYKGKPKKNIGADFL